MKNKIMLKWIVESGLLHNNLGGNFNEVVDVAVSIFGKQYRELSLLGTISELIFLRYRNDENIP